MAFEIGEKVVNRFAGPGVVTGELVKDEDGIAMQMVRFDSPLIGERLWEVRKLASTEPPDES